MVGIADTTVRAAVPLRASRVLPCLPGRSRIARQYVLLDGKRRLKERPDGPASGTHAVDFLKDRCPKSFLDPLDTLDITSFQRQVYINPEHYNKLTPSLVINLNSSNFRIFLTDDKVTCFTCKQFKHLSSSCKNTQEKHTYIRLKRRKHIFSLISYFNQY